MKLIKRALKLIEESQRARITPNQRLSLRVASKALAHVIDLANHPKRQNKHARRAHYLTPAEVAHSLGVSPVTVRMWATRGRLRSITTPGGHRRFDIASVDRLIQLKRKTR